MEAIDLLREIKNTSENKIKGLKEEAESAVVLVKFRALKQIEVYNYFLALIKDSQIKL